MRKLILLWRRTFDIREGERARTLFMSLYLLFVLFAYYILKPVSRALFLNKFDIDKLPILYILIAGVGGLLAYLYTKLALKTSLGNAVTWAMGISVLCLVGLWWLILYNVPWVYFAFNIWVSLFSIVLVSQGWLVAANVFNSQEAKRLYGMLGLGAVVGAAFGGTFTTFAVRIVGTRNLMLASACMVVLAYVAFRMAVSMGRVSLETARATEGEEAEFSFRDITSSILRHRHLQVIMAIITLTYIVDVLVEFQFSAMAKQAYRGDQLTAFLGTFYGIYLNLVTFVLQFFLTALVVGRFGVGGTLQIMPVTISLASVFTFVAPSVLSTAVVRLTEAATRYTFNRTGMELLYLPLPAELKNRTKAFVDIFVDRTGRGLGGVLLILLTSVLALGVRGIALVCLGVTGLWIVLSVLAKNEYVLTVQRRLQTRRLDLSTARLNVNDPATIGLLERTIESGTPRQASYALSLLAEVPHYALEPKLERSAGSQSPEVRGKAYELARLRGSHLLLERAGEEIRSPGEGNGVALFQAITYTLAVSGDAPQLVKEFVERQDSRVAEATLESLVMLGDTLRKAVTFEWIAHAASDPDPQRRRLAALALGVAGDSGTEALGGLIADPVPQVAEAACRSAGRLKNRVYVLGLVRRLSDSRLRGAAIEALAAYGSRICGTLGDVLEDETMPVAVRRQVPRVLRLIVDQRSVDVLIRSIGQSELTIRASVLKALNRLREAAPQLNYGGESITTQIMSEARYYYELYAALAPFKQMRDTRSAARLVALSIEERLHQTLERLFRLLGLRYPPREIYAAYLAVHEHRADAYSAALEFLDSVLERPLKRVLLPLLDETGDTMGHGRDLFGIEPPDVEAALRELIGSGDSWLVAGAMAAAAELKLKRLAPAISETGSRAGTEVAEVARAAAVMLA